METSKLLRRLDKHIGSSKTDATLKQLLQDARSVIDNQDAKNGIAESVDKIDEIVKTKFEGLKDLAIHLAWDTKNLQKGRVPPYVVMCDESMLTVANPGGESVTYMTKERAEIEKANAEERDALEPGSAQFDDQGSNP